MVTLIFKVNAVVVHEDKFVITGSDDGGVRMWSVEGREQTLQFLVMNQVCFTLVQDISSILSCIVCNNEHYST